MASTWCQRTTLGNGPDGSFSDNIAFLADSKGVVYYLGRVIKPAFFHPNDVNNEIYRLSKIYNQRANVATMPQTAGLPDGIIVSYGDVTLIPLDARSVDLLASGESPKIGFIVDFLGDFKRSAQEHLPIYLLSGHAGMIWNANYDQAGKGMLRISAVDASKLSLIYPPSVAVNPAPAVAFAPTTPGPAIPPQAAPTQAANSAPVVAFAPTPAPVIPPHAVPMQAANPAPVVATPTPSPAPAAPPQPVEDQARQERERADRLTRDLSNANSKIDETAQFLRAFPQNTQLPDYVGAAVALKTAVEQGDPDNIERKLGILTTRLNEDGDYLQFIKQQEDQKRIENAKHLGEFIQLAQIQRDFITKYITNNLTASPVTKLAPLMKS